MTESGIVVVGAGLGGLRTVETLRRLGHTGAITLVGAEVHAPYDRPPLTKTVLRGERDSTALREELDSLEVGLVLGRTATRIVPEQHSIELDDGTQLSYTSAVLAPGGPARSF